MKVLRTTANDAAAEWILVSRCTHHMMPNKAGLKDFSGEEGGQVFVGNRESCRILGRGSVIIRMSDG